MIRKQLSTLGVLRGAPIYIYHEPQKIAYSSDCLGDASCGISRPLTTSSGLYILYHSAAAEIPHNYYIAPIDTCFIAPTSKQGS